MTLNKLTNRRIKENLPGLSYAQALLSIPRPLLLVAIQRQNNTPISFFKKVKLK